MGLAASGILGACSAGGSSDKAGFKNGAGNSQNSGNGTGSGSTPGTGNAATFGGDGPMFLDTGGSPSLGGSPSFGGGSGLPPGAFGPQNIDRCADAAKFQGAAGGGGMRLTYPYAGTVFPRGIAAPPIQWDGASPTEILVEMQSGQFTYRECVTVADAGRFQIPQDAWDGAGGWSQGTGDPLHVRVTGLVNGQPVTVTEDIVFALATMKGAIYYNTYDSALAAHNGAVLKLLPGSTQPTVFLTETGLPPLGPCISCHALSADGTTMTANHHAYPAGPYESRGYDVAGGQANQVSAGIPEAGFAAIFRDGSRMLTNGPPNGPSVSAFFPTNPGNVGALLQATSKLIDIQGNVIPSNWDVAHAQMPMFSPDGKHLVYNDHDQGQGHSLWVADFDANTNQFSNKRQIFNDGARYPSWPFFTPDSRQVVFALGTNNEYVSQLPDPLLATALMRPPTNGKLYIVDVASGQAVPMDQANGFMGGQVYLPGGAGETDWEYFTTVSPVAAGGFYWALFTSRRNYGTIWAPAKTEPKAKKIWVTAISIGTPPGVDPSHPAFLLPGQEIDSGNMRAFAALEPCKEDGQSCSSGTECCSGYCNNIDPNTGIGTCGKIEINQCAMLDNKCETDENCCTGPDNGAHGRNLKCINGFCGEIVF